MHILKAFCLAFSTYSRIPMIRVYPNKKNMRYMLCFLPFVGAAVGALFMLWFHVCILIGIDHACFSAVAAVLSVLVTGGIHADGYLDTNDALSSYGTKQKMLEILKDPHVGAFGIITAIVYYVLYFGFLNEVSIYGEAGMIALGFVLSRSLCALEMSLMRGAKNSGILYEVTTNSNKAVTVFVSAEALVSAMPVSAAGSAVFMPAVAVSVLRRVVRVLRVIALPVGLVSVVIVCPALFLVGEDGVRLLDLLKPFFVLAASG